MICLTAQDMSPEAVATRLDRFPDALHEVRLDHCANPATCLRIIAHRTSKTRILATCRPNRQHGGFSGEERRRVNLLKQALAAGVWAVDLEWDTPAHLRSECMDNAGPKRLVLSHHLWRRPEPGELSRLARDMASLATGTIKLAAMADDVADLERFFDLGVSDRRLVVVPMGRAGLIGRARYRQMRSAWTYVASSTNRLTAPGQFDVVLADLLRIEQDTDLFVLLGGDQVHGSPGPAVYNEWFKKTNRPAQYLAAPTKHLAQAIFVLERLGLKGGSVTMPHKRAALDFATHVDDQARRVGAANTLVRTKQGWRASNTDVAGVKEAILRASGGSMKTSAVVLGSGGAAAAAVAALRSMGMTVTILGRNEASTAELSGRFSALHGPLEALSQTPFDILVQATPMGSDGRSSPVANPELLKNRVVLDMVLSDSLTPLLAAARRVGATAAISGMEMWIWQGMAQLRQWTGQAPDPDWMRDRARRALAQAERRDK